MKALHLREELDFQFQVGAIGAIRTRDLLLRRQLLYPAELQPHVIKILTCRRFNVNDDYAIIFISNFGGRFYGSIARRD